MAAAVAGVGPGIVSLLADSQATSRPYLDLAIRCAQWIDRSAHDEAGRLSWPADPLKPESIGLDFYNGMPGVVYFYANLYRATGGRDWRNKGLRAAAYLIRESQTRQVDAGLYTGLAGLATAYAVIDDTEQGEGAAGGASGALSLIARSARTVGDGVEWSDSNDIISGTAGIGLYLLSAAERWKDAALEQLAVRAGRRLLQTAEPAEGGLMWYPSSTLRRNYPNFSHGTAGVAYFLATLYQRTKDKPFLDGALAGARYLDAIRTRRTGARAVFHVSDGGENRFYLSWCHGPVGTARLFYRLLQITGDEQYRQWLDELTMWILRSGAPEQQSSGYWNNISQCCGNVGIGQYFIDLARSGLQLPATARAQELRDRVVKNTLSRATDDETGLRWIQAENRVQPENLVAQTGFMQGAAGVGTFFLQLDAFSRGQQWPTPLPDTPWR
jgi:lantibiotic modifying enzyme